MASCFFILILSWKQTWLEETTKDIEMNNHFIRLDQLPSSVDIRLPLGWCDSENETKYSLASAGTEGKL